MPVGAVLLLFLLAIAGCKQAADPPPPPPAVTVVQPVQQVVTDSLELTGNTQAVASVQLVARVAGYLEKVSFKDGEVVKKGQPLFRIQQDTYQQALEQAESQVSLQRAQVDFAERQFARYSNLLQRKATSQENLDNWRYQRDTGRANLRAAEAAVELAKLNLSYTEVTAPFDGRIDRRLQDPGNLVGAGGNTVLAQLSQIDPIYVYFNISDADLGRLVAEAHWQPGKASNVEWPLFVGLPNEKAYPHRGRLDFASISLTPTTGTLLLRGTIPNPAGTMLPGLYARIQVPLAQRHALLIPQAAIGYDQRGPYVLTVKADNSVQRVGVTLGQEADELRAITAGLTVNDWVVIKGMQKAVPGRPVTPERQNGGGPGTQPTTTH